MKQSVIMACVLMMMVFSACGSASDPTPIAGSPTPNEVIVTPDETRLSRDLPPTWTPTHTPTSTLTPTPSATFTITPSLTPIDIELLCEDFTYDLPEDGESYSAGDTLTLTFGNSPAYQYAFVGVVFEHDELTDVIADIVSGGQSYTARFDIADFPLSGRWDYRIGAFLIDGDGILCQQDGYFMIEARAVHTERPNMIPTALPVPSSTPQPEPTHVLCDLFC